MKVKIVFDITKEDRIAIANLLGEDTPASHADVKGFILTILDNALNEAVSDLHRNAIAEKDNDNVHVSHITN